MAQPKYPKLPPPSPHHRQNHDLIRWTKPSLFMMTIGLALFLGFSFVPLVSARAILGIDLGSSYMKVALVRPGSPLEIVTNLHSKRKTENMILFDNGVRLYGADAAALLARKSTQTAAHVSLALGRDEQHVMAKVLQDHHHPVYPTYNDTRNGLHLAIAGGAGAAPTKKKSSPDPPSFQYYTPEELTAMVLQHAHEIAVQYAAAAGGAELTTIRDCVITVPSFLKDVERRSYYDAAHLADMNVLVLMDETVAAAVQYSMDKSFTEPLTMLFYNMGAISTQVAIVKFEADTINPKKPLVTVLAKAWDETLGGAAFDHVIVEYVLEQYNNKRTDGYDIRTDRPALTKLRMEANKIKHVLSANTESAIHFTHDDITVSMTLSRSKFQELCHTLLRRVTIPVVTALQRANITSVDAVELLGGGVRVPAVTEQLVTVLPPPLELGKHMNADEAFALGSAFVGANASTAFRVRKIGLTDIHPYDIAVHIENLESDIATTSTTESSSSDADAAAIWSKSATIFKAWGKTGVKKTIAFSHDKNVLVELFYNDDNTSIERYNITGIDIFAESKKDIGKPKVSLQFELGLSGITRLIKAEAIVEETYTVQEEIEVEDDDDDDDKEDTDEPKKEEEASTTTTTTTSEKDDDEAKNEKSGQGESTEPTNTTESTANTTVKEESNKAPKKKMKKIKVEKEKKRTVKQPLMIERYYVGRIQPHSPALLAESKRKLDEMDRMDKERIQLEESRNKVESFIYKLKNELVDRAEEMEKVTNEKQRKELAKLSAEAEEWLDEIGYKADRATAEDKYAELYTPYQKIQLRITESTARPAALEKLRKKLDDVEKLMEKWVEIKPQVTEEERKGILDQVKKIQKWADDNEKKQEKKKPHEDPVFLSTDIPNQLEPLERAVVKLGKKPKPKVVVQKENATTEDNSTSTTNNNSTTDDSNSTNATTDTSDASSSFTGDETATTEETLADEPTNDQTKVEDDKASEESASGKDDKEPVKEEL